MLHLFMMLEELEDTQHIAQQLRSLHSPQPTSQEPYLMFMVQVGFTSVKWINKTYFESLANAIDLMVNRMFGELAPNEGNVSLSPEQRKQQIADHQRNLEQLAAKLLGVVTDPNGIDRNALNATSKQIAVGLEQMIHAARSAAAMGLDPDGTLFEGVKNLAEVLQTLLSSASESAKNQNDMEAKNKVRNAVQNAQAHLFKLAALSRSEAADEAFQVSLF
jgi:hypothetical protein